MPDLMPLLATQPWGRYVPAGEWLEGCVSTCVQVLRSRPSQGCILSEYNHPSSITEKLFYSILSVVFSIFLITKEGLNLKSLLEIQPSIRSAYSKSCPCLYIDVYANSGENDVFFLVFMFSLASASTGHQHTYSLYVRVRGRPVQGHGLASMGQQHAWLTWGVGAPTRSTELVPHILPVLTQKKEGQAL